MSRRGLLAAGLVALLLGGRAAADSAEGPLFPAPTRGKCGYVDRGGRMAIAPQWDDAEPFAEGLAAVGNRHEERDGGVSQTVSREGWIDRTDDTRALRRNAQAPSKISQDASRQPGRVGVP